MTAWIVCRVIAITALVAVVVGGVFDLTASDLADAARFVFLVAFVGVSLFGCALLALVLIDLAREARDLMRDKEER